MAQNIQRLMDKRGIDRNKICTDLGFKYTTFTDWVKGNTYPRIDKIEMMANYFGVSKSDLVERYDENKPYYANLEITQFAQALQNSPYANNLITSITDLSEISKHIQDSGKDKWEEIKTEIKDVEDKISDGTIVVTDAQSGEEFDASKCPNVTVK